jgi:uncharacterized OB-fold protein
MPARFRLEASKCGSCGKVAYPARFACPSCRSHGCEKLRLTPKGKVITSTVVRVPADDLAMEAPFAVALVETPEKVRLMMQVADCDPTTVEAGTEVAFQFRRIRKEGHGGILCYGYKAVPV